ncbi:hypothetical protein CCR94_21300 [Rhodoblastus sphagnicola]|uniref:Uncharacterized protein n=1 Tax=Rhodoblastus sphagnicola TaxID=333368 RepID=A0A2S6MX65_9HYPH|nr:hypothetical protein [Rhodoblastus sphagnicola]MBB4199294.1 hypothetical protein [Rhodoblastus sphagnicola]PPQ26962.1 hypothetical protein CCR94_21300 [Rhodoblastus sphagnicola]
MVACVLASGVGRAEIIRESFLACRAIAGPAERLACYDDLAHHYETPRFSGSRNAMTEPFTLDRPHLMRFSSQGVIFVLYLMDGAGNVVQNLHIGGAGEDSYLIARPGVYQLRINAAEDWRIWLEPK